VHTTPNSAGLSFIPPNAVGFSEVSGYNIETEVIKYKEGNDLYERTLPGRSMAPEVVLAKGTDLSNYLARWLATITERTALPLDSARCDLYITMWDRQGAPGAAGVPPKKILVIKLNKCWPSKLEFDGLTGTSGEVNVQKLTICPDGPPEVIFPSING
jgi:phage tail-like protein